MPLLPSLQNTKPLLGRGLEAKQGAVRDFSLSEASGWMCGTLLGATGSRLAPKHTAGCGAPYFEPSRRHRGFSAPSQGRNVQGGCREAESPYITAAEGDS